MHITILALGSQGDIQPYAALGRGLKAAGHPVRFITFESFAPLIARNGLDFHPVQGDAQALVAKAGANTLALFFSFSSLAEGYARDLSAPHLGETDLILTQLPTGVFGIDLAEKFGVPLALVSVIPLARTSAYPVIAFPRLPIPGYNRATYAWAEQNAWLMVGGVINRWRKRTLGLPTRSAAEYFNPIRMGKVPILNGFSQHVAPRPADWGEQVHITGYWFPEELGWQPPADLQRFIEGGSPPVFIGFGSMPVKDPRQTTRLILDALAQIRQRAILHMGWGGIGSQDLPETVFKIDYAPYGWLFPRMAMLIHHGGSGTTGFGLRAGVPSCVVPFVFDQFYWGERIAALGAGPRPIRQTKLSAVRLWEAIALGVNDPGMRQKASELGKKIRAENGIETAVRSIEQIIQTRNIGTVNER